MEKPGPMYVVRKAIRDEAKNERIPVAFIDEEPSEGKTHLIAYLSHGTHYVKTRHKTELAPIDANALKRIAEKIGTIQGVESTKIRTPFWPRSDHQQLNPDEFHSILVVKTAIPPEH